MDIGGFRDMHRHRRCVQIVQDYTLLHGSEMPEEIEAAGLTERYDAVMAEDDGYLHQPFSGRPGRMARRSSPSMSCPWASANARCSRWISLRLSTSTSCAPATLDIFLTAMWRIAMYEAVAQRYPALANTCQGHRCVRLWIC